MCAALELTTEMRKPTLDAEMGFQRTTRGSLDLKKGTQEGFDDGYSCGLGQFKQFGLKICLKGTTRLAMIVDCSHGLKWFEGGCSPTKNGAFLELKSSASDHGVIHTFVVMCHPLFVTFHPFLLLHPRQHLIL